MRCNSNSLPKLPKSFLTGDLSTEGIPILFSPVQKLPPSISKCCFRYTRSPTTGCCQIW